jgi:hypothetical protein
MKHQRRAIVLAFVLLLGGGIVGPGGDAVTYSLRSAECAGLSFLPLVTTKGYGSDGTLRHARMLEYVGAEDPIVFGCDPSLPHGAIVTKVQFTVRDASDTGSLKCYLLRTGLGATTNTGDSQIVGTVLESAEPTGTQQMAHMMTASDSYKTIDNAGRAYLLECEFKYHFLIDQDNSLGIFGATVFYKITAAKG